MDNRSFGVEIEFASNGLGSNGVREMLREMNLWDNGWGNLGHDGSELELRSPILTGARGFKELKMVMNSLRDAGCRTGQYDGLHIHHNAPEFVRNKPMMLKLINSWMNNQEMIDFFVHQRRVNNGACPKWTESWLRSFENARPSDPLSYHAPRGALNVRALTEHGTIELRQHEGTLDYEEAESWIKFGQRFIDGVIKRKRPIASVDRPEVLLNRLRVSKNARTRLITKSRRNGARNLVAA